jgi:hypothetical protein
MTFTDKRLGMNLSTINGIFTGSGIGTCGIDTYVPGHLVVPYVLYHGAMHLAFLWERAKGCVHEIKIISSSLKGLAHQILYSSLSIILRYPGPLIHILRYLLTFELYGCFVGSVKLTDIFFPNCRHQSSKMDLIGPV